MCVSTPKAQAQDTALVFFNFGSHKVEERQLIRLSNITRSFNFSELDSILFLGYADSVGKYSANKKLSERRAQAVAEYMKPYLPEEFRYRIDPLGEKRKWIEETDRRVDIIFYNTPPLKDSAEPAKPEKTEGIVTECHYIDYELLSSVNIKKVTQNDDDYVLLEIQELRMPHIPRYYGVENDSGEFSAVEIKWRRRQTGRHWWSARRMQAMIPAESYEKYRVFTLGRKPCRHCNEDLGHSKAITKVTTCYKPDRFLMANMQTKPIFLNRKEVKVRVPAEYVDMDITYYAGYNKHNPIKWETKKGKRKKHYFHTRVPIYKDFWEYYHMAPVTKIMLCCSEDPPRDTSYINCGFQGVDQAYIDAEVGINYLQEKPYPYAGLGFSRDWKKSELRVLLGIARRGPYASATYQYNLYSTPLSVMAPTPSWGAPGALFTNDFLFKIYIGSELQRSQSETYLPTLQQSLFGGIAIANPAEHAFFKRAFVQYGYGYDYLKSNSISYYPVLQFGMMLEIRSLTDILNIGDNLRKSTRDL